MQFQELWSKFPVNKYDQLVYQQFLDEFGTTDEQESAAGKQSTSKTKSRQYSSSKTQSKTKLKSSKSSVNENEQKSSKSSIVEKGNGQRSLPTKVSSKQTGKSTQAIENRKTAKVCSMFIPRFID